jgi:YfiH family protein
MEFSEADGVRWLSARLPGAQAAFSTRLGGVSAGAYKALNVGLLTGDAPDHVIENRTRLARALGRDPNGFLLGHQVHGAEVLERDKAPAPNPYLDTAARPAEADGQVTSALGLTGLVQVADCLPVALAGRHGVAMLHCGWRGLAAGIIERGAEAVEAQVAAIGPGIGPCCYEVGEEVLERFAELGEGIAAGRMLDLAQIARRLLERAGVSDVEVAEMCTSCEPELFYSHRRDGAATGRQAGLVWLMDDA